MKPKWKTRIEAVKRYLKGERPTVKIYRSLQQNKQWFYFWLKRHESGNVSWFKDTHKTNKIIHNKIDRETESVICSIRKRLANRKYAQKGALPIQWELKKLKVQKIPHIWTINRILKRNNLLKEPEKYVKRNKPYPVIKAKKPNVLHELDLVGPRYLKKANKFYSIHIIDVFSNSVCIRPISNKKDISITEFILFAWKKLGLPKFLQVDNELSFKGSNLYPRSFGKVIRLCLFLGVEIVFVPESEPWRQGVVEKFNDTYDKMFLRSQNFKDFKHLNKEYYVFERFHNKNHRYAKLKGKTPEKAHSEVSFKKLPGIDLNNIPWRDGKVSFVRLTDKKGNVRFFSETFKVNKELVHEYVKGTIFTKQEKLKFYYNNRLIKVVSYKITKR